MFPEAISSISYLNHYDAPPVDVGGDGSYLLVFPPSPTGDLSKSSYSVAKIAGIDFTFTTPTVILLQIFFYVMVTLLFGYKYENNL